MASSSPSSTASPVSNCPLNRVEVNDGASQKAYDASVQNAVLSLSIEAQKGAFGVNKGLALLVHCNSETMLSVRLSDLLKPRLSNVDVITTNRHRQSLSVRIPHQNQRLVMFFNETNDLNMAVCMLQKAGFSIKIDGDSLQSQSTLEVLPPFDRNNSDDRPRLSSVTPIFSQDPSPHQSQYTHMSLSQSDAMGSQWSPQRLPEQSMSQPQATSQPLARFADNGPFSRAPARASANFAQPSPYDYFGSGGYSSQHHQPRISSPLRHCVQPIEPVPAWQTQSFSTPHHRPMAMGPPPSLQRMPSSMEEYWPAPPPSSQLYAQSPPQVVWSPSGSHVGSQASNRSSSIEDMLPARRTLPFDKKSDTSSPGLANKNSESAAERVPLATKKVPNGNQKGAKHSSEGSTASKKTARVDKKAFAGVKKSAAPPKKNALLTDKPKSSPRKKAASKTAAVEKQKPHAAPSKSVQVDAKETAGTVKKSIVPDVAIQQAFSGERDGTDGVSGENPVKDSKCVSTTSARPLAGEPAIMMHTPKKAALKASTKLTGAKSTAPKTNSPRTNGFKTANAKASPVKTTDTEARKAKAATVATTPSKIYRSGFSTPSGASPVPETSYAKSATPKTAVRKTATPKATKTSLPKASAIGTSPIELPTAESSFATSTAPENAIERPTESEPSKAKAMAEKPSLFELPAVKPYVAKLLRSRMAEVEASSAKDSTAVNSPRETNLETVSSTGSTTINNSQPETSTGANIPSTSRKRKLESQHGPEAPQPKKPKAFACANCRTKRRKCEGGILGERTCIRCKELGLSCSYRVGVDQPEAREACTDQITPTQLEPSSGKKKKKKAKGTVCQQCRTKRRKCEGGLQGGLSCVRCTEHGLPCSYIREDTSDAPLKTTGQVQVIAIPPAVGSMASNSAIRHAATASGTPRGSAGGVAKQSLTERNMCGQGLFSATVETPKSTPGASRVKSKIPQFLQKLTTPIRPAQPSNGTLDSMQSSNRSSRATPQRACKLKMPDQAVSKEHAGIRGDIQTPASCGRSPENAARPHQDRTPKRDSRGTFVATTKSVTSKGGIAKTQIATKLASPFAGSTRATRSRGVVEIAETSVSKPTGANQRLTRELRALICTPKPKPATMRVDNKANSSKKRPSSARPKPAKVQKTRQDRSESLSSGSAAPQALADLSESRPELQEPRAEPIPTSMDDADMMDGPDNDASEEASQDNGARDVVRPTMISYNTGMASIPIDCLPLLMDDKILRHISSLTDPILDRYEDDVRNGHDPARCAKFYLEWIHDVRVKAWDAAIKGLRGF